ncbi:hypothetical protein KM043_005904 [Ampulex compressa]|nr:hypothetical protein KM043_005904 [Ampulex compressa]
MKNDDNLVLLIGSINFVARLRDVGTNIKQGTQGEAAWGTGDTDKASRSNSRCCREECLEKVRARAWLVKKFGHASMVARKVVLESSCADGGAKKGAEERKFW